MKSTPTSALERVFRKLYGKPCWRVESGVGSFLTFQFGNPHLSIGEPKSTTKNSPPKVREFFARRRVYIHGDWHLWIYCCNWMVLSGRKPMGDSSTKVGIRRAAEFLDGQKLVRFSISPRNTRCEFKFDLGAILKTQPYDKDSVQWLLYDPAEKVLSLRADGLYQYGHSDDSDDEGEWKPLKR